jgi:NTP pyrophosphatase (non-canonical NTP hydrolase)
VAQSLAEQIDALAAQIAENAEDKGFWDSPTDPLHMVPVKHDLVHTEIAEASRVHREVYDDDAEDPVIGMTPMQEQDYTEELADAIIRLLDIAGYYDLEIGDSILAKVEKNTSRPKLHGKRY